VLLFFFSKESFNDDDDDDDDSRNERLGVCVNKPVRSRLCVLIIRLRVVLMQGHPSLHAPFALSICKESKQTVRETGVNSLDSVI